MPRDHSPASGREAAGGELGGNGHRKPGRLGDLVRTNPGGSRGSSRVAKASPAGANADEPQATANSTGKAGWFDAEAFYAALDAERQGRELTWKNVANSSGISASTLTRIAQGARPDVDSLAALAAWAGFDANAFVRKADAGTTQSQPLAMISTYLKTDPQLTPEAATALDQLIKVAYHQFRKPKGE